MSKKIEDRFKFRYFNKYSNKMVEPKNYQNVDGVYECLKQQVCFDENIEPLPYDHIGNGLVFMQCTGLKDKNGKLIYEGDILEVQYKSSQIPLFKNVYSNNPAPEVFAICWDSNWCCWKCENPEYKKTCEIHSLDISKIIINDYNKIYEVIGNIYENPKLLENQ